MAEMTLPRLIGDGIADDTAAIQALLDKKGLVELPAGCYRITRPLIIHDDTHLRVAAGGILRLADHANCSLLDNDGLYTDTVNRRITIEGGIWDGNHDHQERQPIPNEGEPGDENEDKPCYKEEYISNRYIVLLMRLIHTEHLCLRDITFRQPTSFAVHIADVRYFTVENITLDYDLSRLNMDGIHIQGPARYGRITGIYGDANDDHVALCANGTVRSEITRGAIEDIDIDGIYCENGYTGVRLLSRGDPVRNIRIRNIHGAFRFYAVSFTHHYPLREERPVLLENICVEDAFVSKSTAAVPKQQQWAVESEPLFWFEGGTVSRNIRLQHIFRRKDDPHTAAPTVRISPGAVVEGLTVRDVADAAVPMMDNQGTTPGLSVE